MDPHSIFLSVTYTRCDRRMIDGDAELWHRETAQSSKVDNERNKTRSIRGVFVSSSDVGGEQTLTFPSVMMSSGIQRPFNPRNYANPMCTRCRRNRAPGATLTSLNEGRDSPLPPSPPPVVPRRSLFYLFPFYSSLSFLRGKKAVQKRGALNKQRKRGALSLVL